MKKTMEKTVVILLLLLTLLTGCVHQNESVESSTAPAEEADVSYSDLVCYPSKNFESYLVGNQNDADVLSLRLPSSWVLTKRGSSYVITNERGEIGKIFPGAAKDTALWVPACEEEHKATGTVSVSKIVEKRINGSDFRHRFTYTYQSNNGERTITLTSNYAEADSFAQDFIYSAAKTKQIRTDPKIGFISAASAKNSVLILGNSFIGTSKIGGILQEMCDKSGKTCTVTACSRGYANIGTYATDSSIVNSIKAKNYGAVFICGCYSSDSEIVSHYGTLKAACETAGVPLVLFPAHNESADVIYQIREKYPHDLYLNWKEEINTLISEKGIDVWDFCIDDQHKHSTPLAGYVGAHMIYRAIFGEIPPKYQSSNFDYASFYATLGDYVTNPSVLTKGNATIYWFD
ncbi:MAG: hypothetical protein J5958_04760 [Clostridia bacterium]|nr:hypothetical protein [Clostridia bacterium]